MARELIIWGPPGCGKTTTLAHRARQAADRFGAESVLVCSLTRAAAAEVAGRETPIPRENIGTLHAFAKRALDAGEPADGSKAMKRWNEWIEKEGQPHLRLTVAAPDVDDAATEGGVTGETLGDKCLAAWNTHRARLLPPEEMEGYAAEFRNLWETWKGEEGSQDFTDWLQTCLAETSCAPGDPRVLFADECQDLSALGISLIRKWGEAADHLVMVGDPLQNLYAWAGSDATAFIAGDVEEDRKWVLSRSYRVPRAVHELAMRWVAPLRAELEAAFGKPLEYSPRREVVGENADGSPVFGEVVEGEVLRLSAHLNYPEPAIRWAEEQVGRGKSVMFVAACSYMLEPLLASLRKQGIPFHNPWRTRRGDWNPLAPRKGTSARDRVLAYLRLSEEAWKDQARFWTAPDLWRWVEVLEADGTLIRGAKELIKGAAAEVFSGEESLGPDRLLDWFDEESALAAVGGSETCSLEWFQSRLLASKARSLRFPIQVARAKGPQALWSRPSIIVGTIHSLKGSEADCVVLFPDLSQSAMTEWARGGEGRDGIVRAFYVACTRPREALAICGRSGPDAVSIH